jgi:uncharacterized protein (UPF0147 family)
LLASLILFLDATAYPRAAYEIKKSQMCRDMKQNIIATGSGPNNQTVPDAEQSQATPVRDLAELELIIDKGKAKFIQVGEALAEIKERGLYKPQTWAVYVKGRFNFSRQYAHRLIQALEWAKEMSTAVDIPKTEHAVKQARSTAKRSQKPKEKPLTLARMPMRPAQPAQLEPQEPVQTVAQAEPSKWGVPFYEASLEPIDPETEFERFTNQVELWQDELDDQDVDRLLRRVIAYCEKVMSGEGESNDVCTTSMVSELEEVIS